MVAQELAVSKGAKWTDTGIGCIGEEHSRGWSTLKRSGIRRAGAEHSGGL